MGVAGSAVAGLVSIGSSAAGTAGCVARLLLAAPLVEGLLSPAAASEEEVELEPPPRCWNIIEMASISMEDVMRCSVEEVSPAPAAATVPVLREEVEG
uniref:Putative secreted protein n=1 Tax=Anopheles marajoara TaxID=58244 RepID=A0A2M4C942_9DIPT